MLYFVLKASIGRFLAPKRICVCQRQLAIACGGIIDIVSPVTVLQHPAFQPAKWLLTKQFRINISGVGIFFLKRQCEKAVKLSSGRVDIQTHAGGRSLKSLMPSFAKIVFCLLLHFTSGFCLARNMVCSNAFTQLMNFFIFSCNSGLP